MSSERSIAKQFNVGHLSIHRHKAHITARLAKAITRSEEKSGDEFLDGLHKSIKRMDRGVRHGLLALDEGLIEPELAYRMAPAFAAQSLRARELLGKATGRLQDAAVTERRPFILVLAPGATIAADTAPTAITDESDELTIDVTAVQS